jgi:hypothetical protein
MTRKEWILKNLKGMVQLRALRAVEEQPECEADFALNLPKSDISYLFGWIGTKEGYRYWDAVDAKLPNPDQYLPESYVDVDHIPDNGEMVKDEFLEWLDWQIEHAEASPNLPQAYWAWSLAKEKYNELKK